MTEELARAVDAIQIEFMKRLEEAGPLSARQPIPTLLRTIRYYDDDVVEAALGKVGQRLKAFASFVDFNHSDIGSVFDGALADDTDFGQECCKLLELARYAKTRGFKKVPLLHKALRDSLAKDVSRRIDSPYVNRLHVRFLGARCEREKVRETKRMQAIDLRIVYKRGEDLWRSQPNTFVNFLRYDRAYEHELLKAEKKAKRYADLGCSALFKEIQATIDAFKEQSQESYYGFNRITMTNAAVILAKFLDYQFQAVPSAIITSSVEGKKDYRIVVERKFFGTFNFDVEYRNEHTPFTPVYYKRQAQPFVYEPRVYPLHELWSDVPERIQGVVNGLEEFSGADGKAIFDHFGVIVPGVNYPLRSVNEKFTFLDEDGVVRAFESQEDARKSLDRILMRGRYFAPLLVGERDGKWYFLCFAI